MLPRLEHDCRILSFRVRVGRDIFCMPEDGATAMGVAGVCGASSDAGFDGTVLLGMGRSAAPRHFDKRIRAELPIAAVLKIFPALALHSRTHTR